LPSQPRSVKTRNQRRFFGDADRCLAERQASIFRAAPRARLSLRDETYGLAAGSKEVRLEVVVAILKSPFFKRSANRLDDPLVPIFFRSDGRQVEPFRARGVRMAN